MCDCFCLSLTAVKWCLFVNILKKIDILLDLMYSLLNTILYIYFKLKLFNFFVLLYAYLVGTTMSVICFTIIQKYDMLSGPKEVKYLFMMCNFLLKAQLLLT